MADISSNYHNVSWIMTVVTVFALFPVIGFAQTQEGLDSAARRAAEKAELEQWAGKLYGLFRKADTDRDETLSLLELRNHLDKKMNPGKTSEDDMLLKILMKKNPKLDLDQNNILTKEELVKYLDIFIHEESSQKVSPS